MNAFELCDLAALVCVEGRALIDAEEPTVDRSLAMYWKAARCRLDRWGQGLCSATQLPDAQGWPAHTTTLIEEIFVSEVLSRAVAAIAAAHDDRSGKAEFGPIGRNLLAGHHEARRRAMALLSSSAHRGRRATADLLAVRRQSDRWSDLLLAYLASDVDVAEFAVSPSRVGDFADDARQHRNSAASTAVAVTMILSGMRWSLVRVSTVGTANDDLNRQIATAVVGWFEPGLFDSFGLLRSPWLRRLRSAGDQRLAHLEQWWQPTSSAPVGAPRWRR